MRDHDGRADVRPAAAAADHPAALPGGLPGPLPGGDGDAEQATYRLVDGGEPLEIRHHGRPVTVDRPDLVLDIPPAPQVDPVHQPKGCEPRRRTAPARRPPPSTARSD